MEKIFATARLEELLPKVRSFVKEELLPLEAGHHSRSAEETYRLLDEKREKVKTAGLWGLHVPKNEGGLGLTLCEFGQISEALAQTPFYGHYTFNCQAPDIGNMELLSKFGTAEQKKKYLHPLLEGKIRSCFAMTEPEFAGSNPTRLATTAVKKGNSYVLNGHKWFTSSFEGASFAIAMVVTNPELPKHQRASMIIVPTNTPGLKHIRKIPIFGEAGGGWASHSEIRFENCEVPLANLIGAEGSGFKLAQERLGPGRIHHGMRWIGIAEKALDLMCRRAVSREIDENTHLGEKQFIQGFIAESRVEIDAARLLVLRTAANIDREGAAAMRFQISGIKLYAANMVLRVLDRAIQVHGAMGLTDGTMLATIYQHERGARIWDGADEVHKQNLALSILKEYGLDLKRVKSEKIKVEN
ncbi:MAG TPA: acyl-CoA dehydrogenase family protein [Cyclobacteriaceae bacterium]|nr:acyl-CoA dehydrogenase family protein [Cyclobacteriaceae bacterium]